MRTLIDIPDDQIESLAALSLKAKKPRAYFVRQALTEYIQNNKPEMQSAFGIWKNQHKNEKQDGLAFQKKVRLEW